MYIWLSPKLLSLFDISSNYIIKFAAYYSHYKDQVIANPTRIFIYAANCLYFVYYLSNFLVAFFLAHNSSAYTIKSGLITKKRELPRIFLHFFSYSFQPLFLFLSLMLSKICLAIFKYLMIYKCTAIFKLQFSLTLANFSLLANYPSVKLSSKKAIKTEKIIIKDCNYLTLI